MIGWGPATRAVTFARETEQYVVSMVAAGATVEEAESVLSDVISELDRTGSMRDPFSIASKKLILALLERGAS